MSEEEDRRAKQLEEARKRVEELKKRNKKKKKSKEPESREPEASEEQTATKEVLQSQENIESSQELKTESPSNDTSQLFNEDEKEDDFMTSILKQNDEEEIKRLRDECKKLKFVNMEQETTIEELEAEVKRLMEQVETTQQELRATTEKLNETEARLVSAEQLHLSEFKTIGPVAQPNVSSRYVDREALDKWRNWNVDMTSWRSIGAGPIVEF
ncbi:hypothetical protein HG537_0A02810 [Torulaspora globosa]|uniref:Uncharacterized protein n=1 Tax=Torulaspora globosa TaxID=48254 RepID=A0A7H9HJG5_9SACH|nr:hypothetical protein HG537_0A02810 [Torulaspora sp. CBS 2947]